MTEKKAKTAAQVFETRLTKTEGQRLRTTIVIESESQAELALALAHASELARSRVMFMSFGLKKTTAKVSVRTTITRKRRAAEL